MSKQLFISEAEKRMEEYALHIMSMVDDMESGLKNWENTGMIRIGASMTIGSVFMPNDVKVFKAYIPNMDICRHYEFNYPMVNQQGLY